MRINSTAKRISVLVMMALFHCGIIKSAIAVPITLTFEAHIHNVGTSASFDPGFQVDLGDKITGQFMYDPVGDAGSSKLVASQPYLVELTVGGHRFTTPPEIAELILTANDNDGIFDFPPATTIDTLELFSFIAPVDQGTLLNIDPNNSLFHINLWGNESIISQPELPRDVDKWNAFEFLRQVSVNLRGTNQGSFFFDAAIDNFSVVPEPTAASLCILILATICMSRLHRSE